MCSCTCADVGKRGIDNYVVVGFGVAGTKDSGIGVDADVVGADVFGADIVGADIVGGNVFGANVGSIHDVDNYCLSCC